MMNKFKLDERQLLIRGDIFKHGFFLMGGLLLLYAYLSELGLIKIQGIWSNFLIMMISFAAVIIEKIIRDADDRTDKRMAVLVSLMGILGAAGLIMSIMDITSGGKSFLENRELTQSGTFMLLSIIEIIVFCTFVVKGIINSRQIQPD